MNSFRKNRHILAMGICSAVVFNCSVSMASGLSLDAFKQPETDYHPKTWMHAMNGNLSKPGFSKDFEAMADAGIGAAIFFHVDRKVGLSSRGPVRFGTDEFFDTLVHAVGEAEKFGLEMGVHNSDGWSSSGGEWITPELSMKRVTWSEQAVKGEQKWVPPQPGFAEGFYQDIAVIALPDNIFNQSNHFANAKISTSDSSVDAHVLTDKDWDTELVFTKNDNNQYWVQVTVDEPTTLRSLQIETPSRHGEGALQISQDGVNFTTVKEKLRRPRTGARMWAFSDSFEGYKAKAFRIVFTRPIKIKRFDLWSVPRANNWLAMNAMERGRLTLTPQVPNEAITKMEDVKVLNRGALPKEGVSIPPGKWRILRFGYTSTGARNVPASVEGEGLECDKFDAKALQFHFEQYVGKLARKAKAKGYNALKFSEIDSYEMGGQNWTKGVDLTFKTKFKYDIIPWLPLLTGRVIESPAHSGAVLQEFRQHLSDLMVENYFGEFSRLTKKYDMESYIEPYGWGPFDELAAGGKADRMMGEFWVRDEEYPGRVEAAISSAHIYGKNIVSAESFTSLSDVNWRGHPYFYKHYGDKVWARGINETMFHRFAHQLNTHVTPGMTMDRIGSHIDRTQTWWYNGGKAWFEYLARGSYLLQQGVPDSDFLIHTGDVAPSAVNNRNVTNVPDGFDFDYVNTDVLINRINVVDGWLVLPEGTRYRALELHTTDYLHVKTLQRVRELVMLGATVIGQKPGKPIGFSEWAQKDTFNQIATELWGYGKQPLRSVGKGRISTLPLKDAIAQLGYEEDLRLNGKPVKLFAHRRVGKNDLYYFYSDQPELTQFEVDIREGDGQPEIWNIDDGSVEKITNFKRAGKRLKTTLSIEPYGVRFILIRRDKATPKYTGTHSALVTAVYEKTGKKLTGPWSVYFDPKWSGPGKVTLDELMDWTAREEEGIKHYSGTATYSKIFTLTDKDFSGDGPLYLNLGEVQQIAELTLNGKKLGTLWKPPFALDIRSAAVVGENTLEVKITNTWVNRLIGDEALADTSGYTMAGDTVPWLANNQPPPKTKRVTFTGYNYFADKSTHSLHSSGLIGPVTLLNLR